MTVPIGGAGSRGQIGLDIAGERGGFRPQPATIEGGPTFADSLKQAIGNVQQAQDTSNDYVGKFLRGENVELHQVMAATEEAQLSLEMLIELRNKFTEAYRTVISMQG